MILDDSIISKQSFIKILDINSDATLSKPADLIKLNALSADLTFTLPPVTKQFELFGFIEIVRIDNFTNINNLCKIVAQNPTDLNETNNEIILDIFTSVKIYADLTTGKWQSVDQFSERRIQELMIKSSYIVVPDYDLDNYLEINTIAHAYETVNLLQGGNGWIFDRTTALAEVVATQNSGVEVNFELTAHNLKVGDTFKSTGWTPAAYNTTFPALFTVKAVVNSDNITVDLLSDPGGNSTIIGIVKIIGRTFVPRPYKLSWAAVDDIDASPGNQDGVFIVSVDNTGIIVVEDVNSASILSSYNNGGTNANTHLQILNFSRDSGIILATANAGGEQLNWGIQLNDIMDSIGTVNSSVNPVTISFNGANIKLDFNAGQGLVRATGLLGNPGGLSPNTEILETTLPQTAIIFATRDNVIQAQGTDIENLQFEDPDNPGTLITMTNDNRAKVNFYKGFPAEQFIGEIVGQTEYLSIQLAIDADESPDYPEIIESAIPMESVALLKNVTDLAANATLITMPRIDL